MCTAPTWKKWEKIIKINAFSISRLACSLPFLLFFSDFAVLGGLGGFQPQNFFAGDPQHTGSKFEMDVATFGLDFLEECTTQGRTRSPSDGVPLFQGSFYSIIPWPIRWHEYDTLQMILGIFRHHGAHSCRLSGSNNLLMWLAQHGCLRTELNQFVANS